MSKKNRFCGYEEGDDEESLLEKIILVLVAVLLLTGWLIKSLFWRKPQVKLNE
jgi:uncharacterized membrane protein YciS (DUF1049 family)